MYRTGDKAKLLPDGRIVFLGRIAGDSQVKLRGFRIELEYIASTIVKSSGGVVSEAAVSLRRGADRSGDGAFLVAFVVVSEAGCLREGTSQFLRQFLRDLSLPRYMIPTKMVPVDRLPVNASGKLDRHALNALPIPQKTDTAGNESLTATQERLRGLWLEALPSAAPIGPETDFFEAGGNSLRIVTLREHIAREFSVPVSVFDLFQGSTLAGMAAKIYRSEAPGERGPIDWAAETRVEAGNEAETSWEEDRAGPAFGGH